MTGGEGKERAGGRKEADTAQTLYCLPPIADLFQGEDWTHASPGFQKTWFSASLCGYPGAAPES